MSFVCARIDIIGYVGFVSAQIICIWLCLWVPVCTVFLAVCCIPSFSIKLPAVSFLSIVLLITLIVPSNSISGILSNAGPLPGTTKNLHLTHLLLCFILAGNLLSHSMFYWLYVLSTIDLFTVHLIPPCLT